MGKSPLDPDGKGHHGLEEIGAFWDRVVAPAKSFEAQVRYSFAAGDECVNVYRVHAERADGRRLVNELAVLYRADKEGKIVSLRAFWDWQHVMYQESWSLPT